MCFFNEQWARHILTQVYLSTLLGSFPWMGFSNRWAKYINDFILFAHHIVLKKNASNFCAISKVFSCQHSPQTLCCHLFILCHLINFSVCRAVHLALWKISEYKPWPSNILPSRILSLFLTCQVTYLTN